MNHVTTDVLFIIIIASACLGGIGTIIVQKLLINHRIKQEHKRRKLLKGDDFKIGRYKRELDDNE